MYPIKMVLQSALSAALLAISASAGQVPAQQQQQQTPGVVIPAGESVSGTGNLVVFRIDTFEDGKITEGTVTIADSWRGINPGVDVKLSIPGVKCDMESFSFVQNCKNTAYKVKCKPEGCVQKGTDGEVIQVAATFDYKLKYGKQQTRPRETQIVQRKVKTCGSCQGEGDPHIKNLDGAKYNIQVPGVFTMFESGSFKVQTFQDRCMTKLGLGDSTPSCYKGAAVAFADSILRFYMENDKITVARGSDTYQQWLDIRKLDGETEGYRVFVKADTSSYVDVTVGTFKGEKYMNVALQVSPYFRIPGAVKGLMGNWDGVQQPEEANVDALVKNFQLDIKNNLLTCEQCAPFTTPATSMDATALKLAAPLGLLEEGFSPLLVTQKRSFLPVITPLPKNRRVRRVEEMATGTNVSARAKQLCNQVITSIPHCTKYVADVSYYVDSYCLGDASLLRDLSVVDTVKLAYLRECRRGLDARIEANTTTPAEMKSLLVQRTELSFGDVLACPNECSGAGECVPSGCKCNQGITGFACGIKV